MSGDCLPGGWNLPDWADRAGVVVEISTVAMIAFDVRSTSIFRRAIDLLYSTLNLRDGEGVLIPTFLPVALDPNVRFLTSAVFHRVPLVSFNFRSCWFRVRVHARRRAGFAYSNWYIFLVYLLLSMWIQ